MRNFNILALAALAYTASADKIRASCNWSVEDDSQPPAPEGGPRGGRNLKGGRRGKGRSDGGKITIIQEVNEDVYSSAVVNFGYKGLEAHTEHELVILENDDFSQCMFTDSDARLDTLLKIKANKKGMSRAQGLVDDLLRVVPEEYDGQYAALVNPDGDAVACCMLEVNVITDEEADDA